MISQHTARTLTRMLVRVVDEGTGHDAAIAGYEVAGKTGTAQKLDPNTRRYSRAPGVLSFVGFAPADDPRFVMLVMLDEPKNEKWGSEAAAPIFSAIGADVLRYLQVAPGGTTPVQIVTGPAPESAARPPIRLLSSEPWADDGPRMPDVRGLPLRPALAVLEQFGVQVEIAGRGTIVDQSPAAGVALRSGATVKLALSAPSAARRAPEPPARQKGHP